MFRIEQVWMVISTDEMGEEGVCSAPLPQQANSPNSLTVPLIAADEKRLPYIMGWAEQIAKISGMKISVIKLERRTEVATFDRRQ